MATAQPGFASQQEVYNALIRQGADPQLASTLAAISRPESEGYTAATNHFEGHVYQGLFQIGEFHGFDNNRLRSDDIDYQAAAALQVYREQGLNAWETYTNGSYLKYLNGPTMSSGSPGIVNTALLSSIGAQAGEGVLAAEQNPSQDTTLREKVNELEKQATGTPLDSPTGQTTPGESASPIDAPGAPSPLGNPIDAPGSETIFGNPLGGPHGFDKSNTPGG